MSLDRFRYELHLLGRKVMLTPLVVIICIALLAELLQVLHTTPALFLSAGLEMLLPLMAGILIATMTTRDPAIELQLTLPKTYALTILYRLLLLVGWIALLLLIAASSIFLLKLSVLPQEFHSWSVPLQWLAGQFIWLVPLLWFTVAGLCLGQLTRSTTASVTLVSGIWLMNILFFTNQRLAIPLWLSRLFFLFPTTLAPGLDSWLTSRVAVLVPALVLFPLGWFLLQNSEGLLKGSSEE